MSNANHARRKFLQGAATTLGVAGISSSILDLAVGEIFKTSFGTELGKAYGSDLPDYSKEYCYVHVSLAGAPPRWLFDLPLNPTGDSGAFVQGGFGNWIDVSSGIATSTFKNYSYTASGGTKLNLPPLWGMTVGGKVLTDLLPNVAFIRGMDMEINSHPLSNARQISPIINGLSLSGITADASTKPMAGIVTNSDSGRAFKSAKSLAAVLFPGGSNPLQTVLTPFKPFSTSAKFQAADWTNMKNQALAKFDDYAVASGLPHTTLKNAYDNAVSMINDNVYSLSDGWNDLVNKYKAIIASALSPSEMNALFPNPIKGGSTAEYQIDQNIFATNADLRTAFNGATAAGPMFANLAEQFAVAESLLNNNITSNATIAVGSISNLAVNNGAYTLIVDQHFVGRIASVLYTTAYYRSVAGCLAEFADALRKTGKFDKTVIHVAAEFNRNPRKDGSGADHGITGSNATLISGMIKQASVIGNIKIDDKTNTNYPGTWGASSNFDLGGMNRPIQVNDIALSVAGLMGLSPNGLITNGRALINPSNGLPVKSEAKNV